MDALPEFTPISAFPTIHDGEVETMFQSNDPASAAAIERCRMGDETALSLIRDLIESGILAENLQSCLVSATTARCKSLVEGLLAIGIPVAPKAVDLAIGLQALDILSLFVAFGWDLNEAVEWCYPPPLSLALNPTVDESVVTWFLDNGANPDQRCQMDMTPLSIGVQYAPLLVLKLLLDHSKRPRNGQLLHHAARRTIEDCTAVMQLVFKHFQPQMNNIMYHDHAFSFEVRKIAGLGTALHEAAKCGRPETITWLLDHGADIAALDTCGRTPLEVARSYENLPAISCLEHSIRFPGKV